MEKKGVFFVEKRWFFEGNEGVDGCGCVCGDFMCKMFCLVQEWWENSCDAQTEDIVILREVGEG